jgi:hypothetical protein
MPAIVLSRPILNNNPPPERTLNLLYSAQQRQQHQTPMAEIQADTPVDMSEAPAAEAETRDSNNQRSLHSFWALPSPTSSLGGTPPRTSTLLSTTPENYEYCEVGLRVEPEMAMELDSQMR